MIDTAVADRDVRPGQLTLGSDNGTAFTSRSFRARLAEQGITHRRGGYRDPESQAFIESWFSKLKQRLIWREEFETLRPGPRGDRRLHLPLPQPAPLRPQLPHAARGRGHLARSPSRPNTDGLKRQRRRGPGQCSATVAARRSRSCARRASGKSRASSTRASHAS
ncbi:MAG: transposase family protein [Solirubrobacterales bacterium]|nr:transposase family protein [Solirubrobacterales bacterium]